MAQQGKPDELVTLQELAVSNAYEIAALVAVLKREGYSDAVGSAGRDCAGEAEGGESAVGRRVAALPPRVGVDRRKGKGQRGSVNGGGHWCLIK